LRSHNSEFTDALCPEKWLIENGRLTPSIDGQPPAWFVAKANAKASRDRAAAKAGGADDGEGHQ
jgi:hypothetical protein